MPNGDIGSILYSSQLFSPDNKYAPLKVEGNSATYYLSASVYGSSPGAAVESYSVAANGAISALITRLDYKVIGTSVGAPISQCFRIGTTGNIYGMAYNCNNSPYQTRVCTFSINLATGALTKISDVILTNLYTNELQQTFPNGHTLYHVTGNVYVVFGYVGDGGTKHSSISFSVSADGTSVSLIQHYRSAAVTGNNLNPKAVQLSQNYFATISHSISGGNIEIRTYQVTDGGSISLVDTEVLGTSSSATSYYTDICHIASDIYLCGYTFGATPTSRLATITISSTGVIGSIIDSDDTIMGVSCFRLERISDFILMGTSNWLKTFSCGTDGIIGSVIDSLSGPTSGMMFYTGIGNIYHGSYASWLISVDIVTPAPTIETLAAQEITHNTVTLWGEITEAGAADEYGFDWSLGSGNFENELLSSDPVITGLFCIDLTGLTYNTAYKYRAKIGVGGTWVYGSTRYFTTAFPVPQVSTDPASDADDHYIDAVGHVKTDGGVDSIDRYGFVYGTTFVEDMLGRFNLDLNRDYSPDDAKADGYDANEEVTGALVATILAAPCSSGQPDVLVSNAAGIVAGMTFLLQDISGQEVLTVDHVVGSTVTMTTNLTNAYVTGAYLGEQVTVRLRNLEYGKRYYFRFWAHNTYGYAWGETMVALTSDTVNVMVPTATASKGIRFCIPGKMNFPPTGMWYDNRHHLLVLSPDAYYISPANGGGGFGALGGKYVCERQYWYEATNVDLYTMSNAVKRTGTIVKVKWKARIGNNAYWAGPYHKRVIDNGVTSLTGGDLAVGGSYLNWVCEIFYDNPWTTNPWSIAETDDLRYGISIRSGTGWEQPALDCIEGRICWANAAVTTKPAMLGSDLSHVKFHALVTEDEAEDCTVYFEYGPTISYGSSTTPQAAVKGQHVYENLAYVPPAPGVYYHYRAVIETACGETFYGADQLYPNGLILEIAFEQSVLTASPTWTDVTSELMQLRIKRGRDHQLDNCAAGTATFIMKNASGNWWRKNTGGAYYGAAGGVKPITLIRLRRSYNGAFNMFYGMMDGIVPGWLAEQGGFVPVAQLSGVDAFKNFNKYRIIDADYALTTDEPAGSSHVVLSSVRGYVEGQTVKLYDTSHSENLVIQQVVPALNTIIFTTNTTYAYTVANSAKLKKWPAVLSGTRVHDICLECLWPLALTSIDAGVIEVSEISPDAGGTNALSEMQATKKAEDGNLFMAANGWLVFQDAEARTKPVSTDLYPDTSALTASQATFKDDGTLRKFVNTEISDDDEFIYNECFIVGEDCGEQLMIDTAYQLEQGPRAVPDQTGSIIKNASDAIAQAFIKVERYKDGQQRVKALTVNANADEEDLVPKVSGYELGTRITLQINSARNPAMLDESYHIEGVQHDWSTRTPWLTKWQLWDPNKYRVYNAVHNGFLLKTDDTTNYAAAHGAADADLVYNDAAFPDGIQVGQWDNYAGAIWLSSRIERGYLEFNTASLATAPYPPAKAFLLMFLQEVHVDRAWSLRLVPCSPLGNPLVVANYGDLLGHTDDYGTIAMPSVGGLWLVIQLTASGVASLSYSGLTKFGLRSDKDCDNDDPGGNLQEWATFGNAAYGQTPKLIVQLG